MKIRIFRILGAALAALLPACGGGQSSGSGSGGATGNPAFPVTMTEPSAGQTFTAPATITLSASAVDPASVVTVEFIQGAVPEQRVANAPILWSQGSVVATSTQPPFQASLTDVSAGVHTFVIRMTDKQGAQTFSNSVTVSVLAPGERPGGWMPIARLPTASKMTFVDADRGWVDGPLHTVDGGATWIQQPSGPGQTPFNLQFVDADHGWAIGDPGIVLRSTDGGATWTPNSIGTNVNHGTLSALSFVDSDTGWVGGQSENVFATQDGGVTWTTLPTLPGVGFVSAVRFVDGLNGWVLGTRATQEAFGSVILHTTDGGLTWSEQLRSGPNEDFFTLDSVSATTCWVSRLQGATQNGGIVSTSDGGATWTVQTYPESGAIFALSFVSPTQGWGVGFANTIIHTEDGGRSWVTQQSTSPEGGPTFADVKFVDADVGWAIRLDGILLKTTTGGKAP